MGKERKGQTRITFFVPDNLAIQLKECAYMSRQSVTGYLVQSIVERIKKERIEEIENEREEDLSILQKRVFLR